MLWFFIGHIFSILLSFIRVSRLSENDKDLEIIILRHQLDVMVRKQNKPIRPNRADKATLALLTAQLKQNTQRTIRQLGDVIRIVRPETVIRWHRELVRRKWEQPPQKKAGRPSRTLSNPGRHHQRLSSCSRYDGRLPRLISVQSETPFFTLVIVQGCLSMAVIEKIAV